MLTDGELDLLIIQAKEAAERAWERRVTDTAPAGPAGFVWIELPIDNTHLDLDARLSRASIGHIVGGLKGQATFHRILVDHIVQAPLVWTVGVQGAACKAFSRILSEAGFSPTIKQLTA